MRSDHQRIFRPAGADRLWLLPEPDPDQRAAMRALVVDGLRRAGTALLRRGDELRARGITEAAEAAFRLAPAAAALAQQLSAPAASPLVDCHALHLAARAMRRIAGWRPLTLVAHRLAADAGDQAALSALAERAALLAASQPGTDLARDVRALLDAIAPEWRRTRSGRPLPGEARHGR